jgi:hypothetical protein
MRGDGRLSPRVVELPAQCAVLDSLPDLPVRILVISADGVEAEGRRGLADRLERTAESLGVATGLVVEERPLSDWSTACGAADERFDVVFLRPGEVPADGADDRLPAAHTVGGLLGLLGDLRSRFWLLDTREDPAPEPHSLQRSEALCRSVVSRGGPPAVLLPSEWQSDRRLHFHQSLLEWSLHDAPLDLAVSRATGSTGPVPILFLPTGRRHGLDLGRLLEDYRRRIDGTQAALQMLSVELEALPTSAVGREALCTRLGEQGASWADSLETVKQSCEEINRDRDPAGWSRLGASLDHLSELERAVRAARAEIEALAAAAAPAGSAD